MRGSYWAPSLAACSSRLVAMAQAERAGLVLDKEPPRALIDQPMIRKVGSRDWISRDAEAPH